MSFPSFPFFVVRCVSPQSARAVYASSWSSGKIELQRRQTFRIFWSQTRKNHTSEAADVCTVFPSRRRGHDLTENLLSLSKSPSFPHSPVALLFILGLTPPPWQSLCYRSRRERKKKKKEDFLLLLLHIHPHRTSRRALQLGRFCLRPRLLRHLREGQEKEKKKEQEEKEVCCVEVALRRWESLSCLLLLLLLLRRRLSLVLIFRSFFALSR